MVKVAGPAMSLEASGSIAKTLTFSRWKGRPYVRSLVKPANPQSDLQVSVRAMMKFLSQYWASIASADQDTWNALAAAKSVSPFNAYVGTNLFQWRDSTCPSKAYPPAKAGTVGTMATWTATAGVRSITLDLVLSAAADNWGVAITRKTTTGYSPGFANARFVLPVEDTNLHQYVDAPLDAGTYYYNGWLFDNQGDAPISLGEINATVL